MTFGRTPPLTADAATSAPRAAAGEKPAHYRLSSATWEIILGEYVQGATVTELCAKWRVSTHAVRKRITHHGATKREHGDREAMAQAHERELARAQARREEAEATPEARAKRLFEADPDEDEETGDPAALARLAILASGRAMKGRLWTEAKALAGLAETYGRVGERSGGGTGGGAGGREAGRAGGSFTLADMVRMVFDPDYRTEVMDMSKDPGTDPDKLAYWNQVKDRRDAEGEGLASLLSQGYRQGREETMQALGLDPGPEPGDEFVWYSRSLCRRRVVEAKRGRRRQADDGGPIEA